MVWDPYPNQPGAVLVHRSTLLALEWWPAGTSPKWTIVHPSISSLDTSRKELNLLPIYQISYDHFHGHPDEDVLGEFILDPNFFFIWT